jgi:putative ABC transport system ATP-binding protein
LKKGEFTAIIGASGSGKSTLLHMIGGVDVPTSGKVYLDGQDVYAQNNEKLAIFRRRQVGLIYQFHNLIPTLNVVENITLPVLMDKRKVNQEWLSELLELLGLNQRKKSFTKSIVRWSTAAGLSWASLNECSSSFVGG